jgi:anaerobic magnesium-protoporphyrin IX monomethyl ester cyclase
MNLVLTSPLRLVSRFMSANDFPMVWGPNPPLTLSLLAAMAGPRWKPWIFDAMVTPLDMAEFGQRVKEADAIGITCSASTLALNTEMTLRVIRRLRPDVPVFMGGHHPTYYPEEWLARGATAIVRGEGEHTFAEALERIADKKDLSGVKGLTWLNGGKVVSEPDRELIQDLDTLPFPRWDLMDLRGYGQFTRRPGLTVSVESSRGCTNSCSFCLASRMWSNKQRYQSIPRVVGDLKKLAAMGATQMGFSGDGFGNPPDYHLELAREMTKAGLDMDWVSFMRVDSLLKEPRLAEAIGRAGCKAVFIGFESPRQDLLKKWNKGPDGCTEASTYPEVYRMLDKQGILVFGFMVVGHPEEKPEELEEIFRLHEQWCDVPLPNIIQPMKGTPDYEMYAEQGLLAKDMFYHDVRIPSLNAAQKNGEEAMRIYMRHTLFKYPWNLLSAKKTKRQFFRQLYRFTAGEIFAATREGFEDYKLMVKTPGLTPAEIQDRFTAKYLDPARLDAIAAAMNGGLP